MILGYRATRYQRCQPCPSTAAPPCCPRSCSPSAFWPRSCPAAAQTVALPREAQIGPRPFYLVDKMKDGPLKRELSQCTGPFHKTDFSIGHRGAALQFPEHSKEVLYGRGADGRRRDRMRRDLYKRPPAGLPALAMRPAHHDQHPLRARTSRKMLAAVFTGRSRDRQEGIRQMLHQRHHARRLQTADGEDGRLQSGCEDAGGISERHAALAHRPLRQLRHADDP